MEEHPFSFIASLAERRIAEAREAGAFDNLPGYGKPLTLEDDSHIPPELRMSYRILKNAGYIPPELAERKEIDSLLDMLESAEDEQLKNPPDAQAGSDDAAGRNQTQAFLVLEQADPYYEKVPPPHCRPEGAAGRKREKRLSRPCPDLPGTSPPLHRQAPPPALSYPLPPPRGPDTRIHGRPKRPPAHPPYA